MIIRHFFILSLVLFFATSVFSQLPKNDIYLFSYKVKGEEMQLLKAKFLTDFNPGTYNNQPNFFSYSDLYLTSYNTEEEQTDLIHLDLSNEKMYEVTNTPESEYSPTPMPGKRFLSCIKVLTNDRSSQLLWKYPINQANSGSAVFKNIENVGYHLWLDRERVALFLVGPPHKLAIANAETGESRLILENIGRTFRKNKAGNLLFIHKINPETVLIKEYDMANNRASVITATVDGKEDFDLLEDGSLIMGSGSDLYRFVPGVSTAWVKVASLEGFGINNIGRIASYFDRIAIVNTVE